MRIDLWCRILGRRLSIPKREGYELVRAENLEPGAIRPFWYRHCIPIVRQPSGLHMAPEDVLVGVSRITTARLRLRWEFYFAPESGPNPELRLLSKSLAPSRRNRRTRYIIGRRKTISAIDWFYCFGRLAVKRTSTLRSISGTKRLWVLSYPIFVPFLCLGDIDTHERRAQATLLYFTSFKFPSANFGRERSKIDLPREACLAFRLHYCPWSMRCLNSTK